MSNITRIDPNHRRSRVVVHGDTVYLAGQVAADTSGDITHQTKGALANVDAMLARAGSDKSKVLSATIWLSDLGNFKAMNEVWDAWIDPQNPPARSCGEVKLARPDLLIEVIVVAAR
ncbi:MAG: RidA family protein [Devosia sp.]|jgi:enamine deaminase RidA (YjgF/YER057c/UK114 family)|uniref:RidA family protein n=1 Tax=Devosia sp. TaxID=1871048 RepID=UPI001A622053|nr:RidA family protein [Devosia sp.]MBL8600246.1 RidA family protein [Devosia sp.]